jgi:hypothetical protein
MALDEVVVAVGTALRHGTRTASCVAFHPSNDSVQLRGAAPSAATRQLDREGSGRDMQRGHDASDGLRSIAAHQFRIKPQHAIPEPSKVTVPPGIRSAT